MTEKEIDDELKKVMEFLHKLTDAQIKSEWARRTSAMRKTRSGGRNGGRRPNATSVSEEVTDAA